jgi:Na+/melibiose symporter-like transporter
LSNELSNSTRVFYATGAAAPAVVLTLASSFILIYYSTALGAPPAIVGGALALALVFDAIGDPIVGYLSDNTRSSWGRRHPFMYVAIVPVTLLCWAVWNPPASLGAAELVLYLIAIIIPLRIAVSVYDVPNVALTAELTRDYDERTRLAIYRTCANWVFITAFTATVYGYWLRPSVGYPDGLLNPDGYRSMGFVASVVVCVAMLVSAVGLHSQIPRLAQPSSDQRSSFKDMFASVLSVFRERAVLPLLLSAAAISTGFSAYGALFAFYYGYFWGLNPTELSLTMVPYAIGLVVGFLTAPIVTRIREKRTVAMAAISALSVSVALPVLAGLAGLAPIREGSAGYPIVYGFLFVDMVTYILVVAALFSMVADAVEHRELSRGRREEGTVFSIQTLVMKISSALGVLVAGITLQAIGFADEEGTRDVTVTNRIGLAWIVVNVGLYAIAIVVLRFYRVTRKQHETNVARLDGSSAEA